MDAEEFAEFRLAAYHSWRYWLRILLAVAMVAGGVSLLVADVDRGVGLLPLAIGIIVISILVANRWLLDHRGVTLSDIRLSRWAYLVPIGLLAVGITLLLAVGGSTSPAKGYGLWLACNAVGIAAVIAVLRAMANTDQDATEQAGSIETE